MSWTSIFKVFSSAARSGGAKVGFKAGEAIGTGLKGFSSWVSSWKLGNVLKIGGTGGIVAVIYSTWRSGVSAIADATGLSEDTTATLIGLAFAALILYVIVRLILPPKDRMGYDDRYPYDDWQWRGQR
ncbi:MAG: hypothetical protein IKQ67_02940 [Candidatus Methanomethylophilaceae archaeon]|nr:hypothetical protein [Candidatus Methanomethylophilaceae archaeon]